MVLFQLIPARGRKPINEPVFASQAVISTYPRKGTETSAISLDGEWMPISTYPRKGTETRCGMLPSNRFLRFQLIPARGRKLAILSLVASSRISTYPRKGTETGRVLHRIHSTGFQLIPARGRKLYSFSFFTCIIYFNSSPQGDGNPLEVAAMLASATFQLIPARGQKTPHQKRCGVFLLQTLTLCFPWAIPL